MCITCHLIVVEWLYINAKRRGLGRRLFIGGDILVLQLLDHLNRARFVVDNLLGLTVV